MTDGRATRPGWPLLAEALAALAAGASARRVVPFPRIAKWLSGHVGGQAPATAAEVESVRRAIDAWTRRLPVEPKCFSRGLAAFWMLRRRGRDVRLHYGAATIRGQLKAHVWVRSGDHDVVGCQNSGDYALLATFPENGGVSAG